ncbi:MAG TPA: lysylphosphatidylglycerol synthase domain-containing protein, partial [Rhodanobacteraceae bacterium]
SVVVLGLVLHFARKRPFLERWHVPALPPTGTLVFCLACCVTFFIIAAGLLDGLAHALGFEIDSFAMLLAASAASWAAGFVVVGAPGGLGVREAAFVALAGTALGESHALLLIGLFRVVTFLGDTLFFAAGAIMLRKASGSNPNASAPPSQPERPS